MFDSFHVTDDIVEARAIERFVSESNFKGVTPESLLDKIDLAGLGKHRCDLIAGDITETAPKYVAEHPGLRISLLHLHLDLDDATYAALEVFWPRIVVGGLVILDEYAVSHWTESNAADRFFHQGACISIHCLGLEHLPHIL